MELIILVLLMTSVYFSTRFFMLSRNIDKVIKDFKYISKNKDSNRRLKLAYPERKSEKLLIELNKHLEENQKYKLQYVKREEEIRKEIENISHDLRTPLTSILGYLELMKDDDTTEMERDEYIPIIERKSKSLQKLIEIFYDMSRLEANDYKIEMVEVDIHKLLMEQMLLFYKDFEQRNIDVNIDLADESVMVLGDVKAIDRVLSNLINNAIKYTKSSLKVSLERDEEGVVILFANDTDNLGDEDVENLFKPFYMGDKSRYSGSSGLGLTVTKMLVEKMNWNINSEIMDGWIYFKIRIR